MQFYHLQHHMSKTLYMHDPFGCNGLLSTIHSLQQNANSLKKYIEFQSHVIFKFITNPGTNVKLKEEMKEEQE